MTSAFVDCGNWRVHYEVAGDGPALILLHGGAPGSSGTESFARNIPELSKHFRTYAIDFPGWGQSSRNLLPGDRWANPLELAGDVVVEFMGALGIPKAHLLGGSFGGAAALYAALKQPEMFDKLVLAAPGGGVVDGPPSPGLVRLLTYYDQKGPSLEKMTDLLAHCVLDASILPDVMIAERFKATDDRAYAEGFPIKLPPGGLNSVAPLCEDTRLATMGSPVLFAWGRQDRMQPFGALQSFNRIPNQRTLAFDACGHWPYWEWADAFNRAAIQFLRGDSQ